MRTLGLVVLLLCGAGGGCTQVHHIEFFNGTSGTLNSVRLVHAEQIGAGVLLPGLGASCGTRDTIPETAVVGWQTPDGASHEQEVKLRSAVPHPDHFRGTIFLKIEENGVRVVPWSEEQSRRMPDRYYPWGPTW